ncbi:MAG: citrate lyase subunit beta [marine bacterium B5-7]|nr:MAG: citrate lyase subunit beta [marine bacterium B5-7]
MTVPYLQPVSWLFVGGVDESELKAVPSCGTDVAIQDLEDFTPPNLRVKARRFCADLMNTWRTAGIKAAVRINPLHTDGLNDLDAALAAQPDYILLPKVSDPGEVLELVNAITSRESGSAIGDGSVQVVPNIETARGVMQTYDIAMSSERIAACLVAAEDLANDLGAERGRDGIELAYARQRFLLECRAADVLAIDCPYTWTDIEGLEADIRFARRLGYMAKSTVTSSHVEPLNRLMRPSPEQIISARKIVAAFETAQQQGDGRVLVDGSLIELPIYLNARRLLDRQ